MGLRAIVLGSAAGGGLPQWNCGCRVCAFARSGDPRVRPRTQASVAVSADGCHWLLIGASPDLRQQIVRTAALSPREGLRHSPVHGAVLVSADVDGIAGLLVLREGHAFGVYGAEDILAHLDANRVFDVLDPGLVTRVPMPLEKLRDCGWGVSLTLLPMPGKLPLYLEDRSSAGPEPGAAYAALLESGGRRILVAPACAEITEDVRDAVRQADAAFFDGTLFTDNEMITAGVGPKTGRRMGHVPMSGPDGSLARLADLPSRRIFFHINNTNPVLIDGSPECRTVETAGFEVAYDGMEVRL
jgi:pyrroloquinoline quinone biosynthesis protein B